MATPENPTGPPTGNNLSAALAILASAAERGNAQSIASVSKMISE